MDTGHRFIRVYFQQGMHDHEMISVLKGCNRITIDLRNFATLNVYPVPGRVRARCTGESSPVDLTLGI